MDAADAGRLWRRIACLGLGSLLLHVGTTLAGQLHSVLPITEKPGLFIIQNGCVLEEMVHINDEVRIRLSNCTAQPGTIDNPIAGRVSRVGWQQSATHQVELRIALVGPECITTKLVDENQDHFLVSIYRCGGGDPATTLNLLSVHGLALAIPVQGMNLEMFIDQSLGYVPTKDLVRDGLPNFGSMRGDWQGRPRLHQGIDIYVDSANVMAAADGTVTQAMTGRYSGRHVKIRHSATVSTVYAHLKRTLVRKGDQVSRGQVIATIDGPTGNAIESQLHFELQVNGKKVDPYHYIKQNPALPIELQEKIRRYEQKLIEAAEIRAQLVR